MYSGLAVEEMLRSGIPASITLAQGVLESGDGNSRLAKNANNHFGIKCHNDWNGKTIKHDDDEENECFRKYGSVEASYRDHSDYLMTQQRYAFLFELPPGDYKAWARGLKRAGYATSPTYASKLIEIIEENNLQRYDEAAGAGVQASARDAAASVTSSRQILQNNRVKYVIARKGDSFESITGELGKLSWELPRYNEREPGDSLSEGQMVYIQPKRNKAEAGRNTHTVAAGETMYDISQRYAIKLTQLYALNGLGYGSQPDIGTVLQLRKAAKGVTSYPAVRESMPEDEEEIEMYFEFDP